MFNWSFSFITDNANTVIMTAFVFSFCNLVVSTCFDIAFHGLLRIRLAASRGGSSAPNEMHIDGSSSLSNSDIDKVFNVF